jgi:hypothetical protein
MSIVEVVIEYRLAGLFLYMICCYRSLRSRDCHMETCAATPDFEDDGELVVWGRGTLVARFYPVLPQTFPKSSLL